MPNELLPETKLKSSQLSSARYMVRTATRPLIISFAVRFSVSVTDIRQSDFRPIQPIKLCVENIINNILC